MSNEDVAFLLGCLPFFFPMIIVVAAHSYNEVIERVGMK